MGGTLELQAKAPAQIDIYLQFEIWNQASKTFETLPKDVPVELMDHFTSPLPDYSIDKKNTDDKGCIHFVATDLKKSKVNGADIFFLAHTKGIRAAGIEIPVDWSTKGWKDKNGKDGYYPSFKGTELGTAAAPLVFRIGLDYHVRLTYDRPGHPDELATKGIPIGILANAGPAKQVTPIPDFSGEVHGLLFSVDAGDNIFFSCGFELEDPSINLPRAKVWAGVNSSWWSWDNDKDKKIFEKNVKTSIGAQTSPEILRCSIEFRNVALYFLKVLRELSTFLFHITNGLWTGIQNLILYKTCLSGDSNAYSWPVTEVNIGADHHWKRDTLVHEISHQVMWKESQVSSLGIAYQASPCGDLNLVHYEAQLSNPTHAAIEGWAEFMEQIFTGGNYTVASLIDKKGKSVGSLGPPPVNQGESVEGAFANGLSAVFDDYVVNGSGTIRESANGDIMPSVAWLAKQEVKDRFKAIIWAPLQELRLASSPTTTHFIEKMRTMHPAGWHKIAPSLHRWNLAIESPKISSISPNTGPIAGGQTVTIQGSNFVVNMTVEFDSNSARNIRVDSSTSLQCETPAATAPKDVDVSIKTVGGTHKLTNGFKYT